MPPASDAIRPPHYVRRLYASFRYQAQSWDRPRRVVAKVEWHPGELYPRVGFIVTNLHRPAKKVVAFYTGRGTAEQWIKEGKNAVKWTRLSCVAFRERRPAPTACAGLQPRQLPDGARRRPDPRGGRHDGRKPLPPRSQGRYVGPGTGMGSVHASRCAHLSPSPRPSCCSHLLPLPRRRLSSAPIVRCQAPTR